MSKGAKFHKTEKGTELPISSIKGKDYLEVKYRLVWFREEHHGWGIETNFVQLTESFAMARAEIKDDSGRIVAVAHKTETPAGFPDYIEKAETGAIGRALALIGYGTQFCADELDEGERIVDAPIGPKPTPTSNDSAETAPLHCGKPMMVSKFPNKITGEHDWYCFKCRTSLPRVG